MFSFYYFLRQSNENCPQPMQGRSGTTDDFATHLFHLILLTAGLMLLVKSISVHSLTLSSHFFCLTKMVKILQEMVESEPKVYPKHHFPYTLSCRTVWAKQEDKSPLLPFLSMVKSSSYFPTAGPSCSKHR